MDPPAAFDVDTAVTRLGPGRYAGHLTDRWHIGVVPNGGYVLAVALAAVRDALGRQPLTVTAHYLGPSTEGPAEIEVELLKEGRLLSTASARLIQEGKTRIAVLASYGNLADQTGPTLLSLTPPELPDPDECLRPQASSFTVQINDVVEYRPSPESARWMLEERGRPAEVTGWLRFRDGRPPDIDSLPLLCDAMPPAVFAAIRTGWVPTLELTVHVRAEPAPGWIRARVVTRALIDGLCEEDCELWDSAGHLVAMSRQLARVLPPAE